MALSRMTSRMLAKLPRMASCTAGAQPGRSHWRIAGGLALTGAAGALAWEVRPARAEGKAKDSGVPPFSLDTTKYDESTFFGRLMGMYETIDPRTLLVTTEDLKKARQLLDSFKATGKVPEGSTDAELWEARRNIEVSIHPVTGEELFRPGRMSAFVPMNAPMCAMMLMAEGPKQVLFAQWLNQTYNVVNNYVNRSGATVDWSALLPSYGLAVTTSCGISLGAGKLISAVPALQGLGAFVPYLAVISAGSANVAFTRSEEWRGKGVSVCDADGKDLGLSQKAGQTAVLQTVVSRSCFLPIAPMVVPVVIMKALKPMLKVRPVAIVTELVLITSCIGGALPIALSILPQKMEIDVKKLEPEFQNLTDSRGQPVTTVFANKGL